MNDQLNPAAIPTVSIEKFRRSVAEIGGRELTPGEIGIVDRMGARGDFARHAANQIFGEAVVDQRLSQGGIVRDGSYARHDSPEWAAYVAGTDR